MPPKIVVGESRTTSRPSILAIESARVGSALGALSNCWESTVRISSTIAPVVSLLVSTITVFDCSLISEVTPRRVARS